MAEQVHQLLVTVEAQSLDEAVNDVSRALVEFGFDAEQIRVGEAPATEGGTTNGR